MVTAQKAVIFQACSHSRKKRELASSCPSVCPRVSARLPPDALLRNFIMGAFMMHLFGFTIEVRVMVPGDINSP